MENTSPTTSRDRGRGSRRLWSPEEKRRIVEEAVRPGASVADVARRHGLNANLVFTWKRAAGAASASAANAASSVAIARPDAAPSPGGSPEFMPIGIVAREQGGAPAEIDDDLPLAVASGHATSNEDPAAKDSATITVTAPTISGMLSGTSDCGLSAASVWRVVGSFQVSLTARLDANGNVAVDSLTGQYAWTSTLVRTTPASQFFGRASTSPEARPRLWWVFRA